MVPVILMKAKRSNEFYYMPASQYAFKVLLELTGYGWLYASEWGWVSHRLNESGYKLTSKWCHVARVPTAERLHYSDNYTCNVA